MVMSIKLTLPHDPEWLALTWAQEHCDSYITHVGEPADGLKSAPGGWVRNYRIVYYIIFIIYRYFINYI
jgi:hypothetical protein